MPLSLPEDVLAALDKGEPDRLIGTRETHQIFFRSQPYPLGTGTGAWELAEDVADLANHSGGVIIIGVRTANTQGGFPEVAAELRPAPASTLNVDQYQSVIREQVRPRVESEVAYFPAPHHAGRGYLSIRVRRPGETGRPVTAWQPRAGYRPLFQDQAPGAATPSPGRGTSGAALYEQPQGFHSGGARDEDVT